MVIITKEEENTQPMEIENDKLAATKPVNEIRIVQERSVQRDKKFRTTRRYRQNPSHHRLVRRQATELLVHGRATTSVRDKNRTV